MCVSQYTKSTLYGHAGCVALGLAAGAPPSAATSPSPSPSPPPARGRAASRCSPGTYEPTTRPSTRSQARSAASTGPTTVTLHLLTHAWVARAVRLPAVLVVQRARLRDVLAVHPPRPRALPPAPCLRRRCRACGGPPSWYSAGAHQQIVCHKRPRDLWMAHTDEMSAL
jgi:hypothetical protein